jgi:hypothetical protein
MRTNPHCHLSTSVKHTNTAPPTTTLELIEMTENDIGDDIKTKFAISFNHCTSQETFNGFFPLCSAIINAIAQIKATLQCQHQW